MVGDGSTQIERIADLEQAGDAEIAYVENENFLTTAAASKAACLIVPEQLREKLKRGCAGRTLIEVSNPKLAFVLIGAALHPPFNANLRFIRRQSLPKPLISRCRRMLAHVSVGEFASVGAHTRLEAGVVLGANVTVGDHCVLHPNVVLYDGVSVGNG